MKFMKRLAPLLLSAALLLGAAPVQAAGALTRGAAHEPPSKSIWTPSRTPQL